MTFTLSEDVEGSASRLKELGGTIDVEQGRTLVTVEVDLHTRTIDELEAEVLCALDRQFGIGFPSVWPTRDRATPLHEQLPELELSSHPPLSVRLYLVGTGWGLCVLAAEGQSTTLSCSHLNDAVGDLVDLGCAALDSGEGSCVFAEEPGEYQWHFEGGRLRVLWFSEDSGPGRQGNGELVFDLACSGLKLARAILRCASEMEVRYGPENYARLWPAHPFPTAHVDRLRHMLRAARR